MKREVKVRGRDVVLYLLRQKKKLVREERDSGGHTVYIFELDDDDLLLFSYDTENRKAEYVKKVSVKDGKMEFTLKEGGHYFIAKRALASSLDESTDAEKQEIQDASDAAEDVPWDASEETVVLGNGDDTDTGATTAEKKTAMVRWGLIGLIALVCCAAIGVVVYNKRKGKGKLDLSKEKGRKDGGK